MVTRSGERKSKPRIVRLGRREVIAEGHRLSFCAHIDPEALGASAVSLVVAVSGYDVVAAQTGHARKSYDNSDLRFGRR